MLYRVHVPKLNEWLEFDDQDPKSFPDQSQRYSTQYGLNKCINDSNASIVRKNFETDEKYLEAVRKPTYDRIKQLRTGTCPNNLNVAPPQSAIDAAMARLTPEQRKAVETEILAKMAKMMKAA